MTEIVLGPPGTGKTTKLLEIVDDELIRGVPPDRIGYFSFTKRAAQEAIDRAVDKFHATPKEFPYFRTIHSFCFKQLGLKSDEVFQGRKVKEYGDAIGIKVSSQWTDDDCVSSYSPGDRMLFMENLARTRMVDLRDQYDTFGDDQLYWHDVKRVSDSLKDYKRQFNLVDYTDMLTEFVHAGPVPKLEILVVDEGQDLSKLQWAVVNKIKQRCGCRRFIVAGDDDQAIYRWAGADVDSFLTLEGDAQVLGQSWRVPQSVQSISNHLVDQIGVRREKHWAPRAALGEVDLAQNIEAVDFEGDDILVLARNAYLLETVVEPELKLRGMLYKFRDKMSVKESYLRAIFAWESLRSGDLVPLEDAKAVYELMSSGLGYKGNGDLRHFSSDAQVSLSDLQHKAGLITTGVWHEALDRLPTAQMSYLLAARRRGERLKQKPRIKLSTIHAAKGGEAQHVVILQDMARRTYKEMEKRPDDEARVWYVATTRARERLSIVSPQTKFFHPL